MPRTSVVVGSPRTLAGDAFLVAGLGRQLDLQRAPFRRRLLTERVERCHQLRARLAVPAAQAGDPR